MPALRRGLRLPAEKDALRQDMLRLLGATLLILPSLQPEMASLLSPHEPEADFFQNVTHVQMPRRQRALARLRQRVAAGAFSAATMSGYLLPMLRHLVLRPDAKEVDVAGRRCRLSRKSAGSCRGGPTSRRFRPLHACSKRRMASAGDGRHPRRLH